MATNFPSSIYIHVYTISILISFLEGEDVFVPPDGGYGWWITFGAFLSLFWTAGLVKSYGVIFAEMVRLYPNNIK